MSCIVIDTTLAPFQPQMPAVRKKVPQRFSGEDPGDIRDAGLPGARYFATSPAKDMHYPRDHTKNALCRLSMCRYLSDSTTLPC